MSQYKAAMERMQLRSGGGEDGGEDAKMRETQRPGGEGVQTSSAVLTPNPPLSPHPAVSYIEQNAPYILMPVLPLLWCLLLVLTLDRDDVLSLYAMPLLGVCSAALANAVPVGGGIVFVPILEMFGVRIRLGAAFAVATMTFGNGVFGFLNWMRKSPGAIAWEIMPSAILPAWIGAAIGTLRPLMSPERCRSLFAAFSLMVSMLVWRGIYVGRQNNMQSGGAKQPFSITRIKSERSNDEGNSSWTTRESTAMKKWRTRSIACVCSFLAGLVLVAHIGIGNAVVSFLVSSFVWKLPANESVVTSIIIGGWTSACPFLLHLLILKDVPIALWVMGLPGVYAGARIAPIIHERMGIANVLSIFALFLLLMAVVMISKI